MLQLDPKWGETSASLLRRSSAASHPRLRERYAALSLIASGESGIAVAEKLGRSRQSISEWVRKFNEEGPSGVIPGFQGHAGKRLTEAELAQLKEVVRKPPRKHFRKGDPKNQRAFAEEVTTLEQNRSPRSQTVWVEEGQLWCDALLRWMWCLKGEDALVDSSSPSLREKICFYVAVVRPMGLVITSIVDWFNKENTALFLDKIRAALPGWRIDLLWDGSKYHQGKIVTEALHHNRIHLHPIPPYSPKMNAAEYWSRWVKTDLSYN